MAKILTDAQAKALNDFRVLFGDMDFGGIMQSAGLKKKGTFTTLGGDATESITDADVVATDLVIVMLKTEGSTPVTVDAATAAAGAITVTMSADPSTDHVLQYFVFEA